MGGAYVFEELTAASLYISMKERLDALVMSAKLAPPSFAVC